jgi:superfamily I DNA and/or RNA helicase
MSIGILQFSVQEDIDKKEGILNNIPVEFYNIKGHGEKKKNKLEADLIVRLIQAYYEFISANNLKLSIGVIAPFRAQAALISQELILRNIHTSTCFMNDLNI